MAERYPALSIEENLKLARLARTGDLDARNRFALHHIQQIVRYARRHSKPGELADVVQKCLISLMLDVQHMQPLTTHNLDRAVFGSIRRSTVNYDIEHGRIIRVTDYMRKLWRQIESAKFDLAENLKTSPDIAELVKITGLTEKQIVSALKLQKILDVMSLDDQTETGTSEAEFLPASESLSTNLDKLEREERKKFIENILQKLKKRSRMVLILRFGIEDGKHRTQEEVGLLLPQRLKRVGDPDSKKLAKPLTKDAVSHIERRALKTLKRQFGVDVRSFLE